jgi:hypothetical protein
MLKKIIAIALLLLPIVAWAQLLVPQGGSGLNIAPPGYLITGSTTLRFVAKNIIAGSGMTITSTTNSITFVSTATGGGGVSDWVQNYNYNTLMLTPSTTIPVWAKSGLYASSTFVISGIQNGDVFRVNDTPTTTAMFITSTSTIQMPGRATSSVQVLIGTSTPFNSNSTAMLDQLTIAGRFNLAYGWRMSAANFFSLPTALSADGALKDDFTFWEDNTCTLTSTVDGVITKMSAVMTSSTVNDGCMIAHGSVGGMYNTQYYPAMEVKVKILAGAVATTTPEFFVGFTSKNPAATDYEVFNDEGCFFFASTTQANWVAACKTSTSMQTVVTTAPTSTYPGNYTWGQEQTLRVMLSPDKAYFYIGYGPTTAPLATAAMPMQLVAEMNISPAWTTAFKALVRTTTGQRAAARTIAVNYMRVWWFTPGE